MRQGRGDADESHLPLLLHFLKGIHQLILLCYIHGRIVQLHDVDMIGFHALEAFLQSAKQIVACPNMRGLIGVLILADHGAATFRSQIEFIATVSDIFSDEFFTPPVVIRRVYEIDALIEYRIQNGFGLLIRDRTSVPDTRTADLHGSETQAGNIQACAAQNCSG